MGEPKIKVAKNSINSIILVIGVLMNSRMSNFVDFEGFDIPQKKT